LTDELAKRPDPDLLCSSKRRASSISISSVNIDVSASVFDMPKPLRRKSK